MIDFLKYKYWWILSCEIIAPINFLQEIKPTFLVVVDINFSGTYVVCICALPANETQKA